MLNLLKMIDARLGEPSTYASIAAVLAMSGVSVNSGVMHEVAIYGVIIAGGLGVILKEAGAKPAAEIASDVATAVVAGIQAMPKTAAILALIAFGSLSACKTADVQTATTGIATACALAPIMDTSASQAVQVGVAEVCSDEQKLAPVVTPLIPVAK